MPMTPIPSVRSWTLSCKVFNDIWLWEFLEGQQSGNITRHRQKSNQRGLRAALAECFFAIVIPEFTAKFLWHAGGSHHCEILLKRQQIHSAPVFRPGIVPARS